LGAFKKNGGMDGTRTRDLCSGIPLFEGDAESDFKEWTQTWTHITGTDRRDLAAVVECWSALPKDIKGAILAIISPYQPGGKQ